MQHGADWRMQYLPTIHLDVPSGIENIDHNVYASNLRHVSDDYYNTIASPYYPNYPQGPSFSMNCSIPMRDTLAALVTQ